MEEAPTVNSDINKKENIFIAISNSGENIITMFKIDKYIIFKTSIFINNLEKNIEKKLEFNDFTNYYNLKKFNNIDLIYDEICKISNENNITAKEEEKGLILNFPLKNDENLIIKLVDEKGELNENYLNKNYYNSNDNDKRLDNIEKIIQNYEKRICKLENEIIYLKHIINDENINKKNNFNINKNEIININEINNNKNDNKINLLNNNNNNNNLYNFSKKNIFDFQITKTFKIP